MTNDSRITTRERRVRWRVARREQGLCVDCPKPSGDFVRCSECRVKLGRRASERRMAVERERRKGAV